jgi:MATE family multidrug resistance protein
MHTSFTRASLLSEAKTLLFLALPIIANGLLESSYGFTNTFMVAHLGQTELAASALVTMLFVTVMVIFWGLISSTSVIISHYHGAENMPAIRGVLRDAIYLALILSIPIMMLLWFAPDIFLWSGQSAFIVREATKYLHALIWAVPADLLGFVIMQFFQGISRPRITFTFTLLYIPVLIFFNYILIFGKFGFPELKLAGIGWGAATAYTFVLALMLVFIYNIPFYRKYLNFKDLPATRYFSELLRVGLPLGGMYSIEIGYFLMLAVMMGKISNTALAAHQIVLQYFWVSMNMVFSIGQALSIRTGWRLGRNEPEWVLPIAKIGQLTVMFYCCVIATIYCLLPHQLIALDFGQANTAAKPLSNIAVKLFICAGIFQLVEGCRITSFSILRGMKDTRFTMFNSIVMFWAIALPVGYYLAFHAGKSNPTGLWLGLIISAIFGAVVLGLRLIVKSQGAIESITATR